MTTADLRLGGLPGVASADELDQTGQYLANLQHASGEIPWYPGGHSDPWNHVEVAMALTVLGRDDAARAAYDWLIAHQLGDGSWFNYYRDGAVEDARLDTNVCAYLATGLCHYLRATEDVDYVAAAWPALDAALAFVVAHQDADGPVRWSRDPSGRLEPDALLTGSSSIYLSLRCGLEVAARLGHARGAWSRAAGRLGHAVAHHPGAFAPKNEYAMDWYYPVLTGALEDPAASDRLDQGWERHVLGGRGVRCVSTSDWVTAAETAECALALDAVGRPALAAELLATTRRHRRADGAYLTGLVYPTGVTFPGDEVSSYTAAAVVLALDAVTGQSGASALFHPDTLGRPVDRPEAGCGRAAPQHP
ncbi:MAG: prenyltransferase [Acidimicrobiales bacterium]